jgi:hypothetical protein
MIAYQAESMRRNAQMQIYGKFTKKCEKPAVKPD